jgi:hypothetical protein
MCFKSVGMVSTTSQNSVLYLFYINVNVVLYVSYTAHIH